MRRLLARTLAMAGAILALAAAGTPATAAAPVPPHPGAGDVELERLAGGFAHHWLSLRPHEATRLGLTGHDDELVPITQALLDTERAWHNGFAAEFQTFRRRLGYASLSPERRVDYALLEARLDRARLDLDVLRPFERDPNAYLPLVDASVRGVIHESSGSTCGRLRAVARRLAVVPEVLRAAQVNLGRPSRIATETAIEAFGHTLDFYRNDLPRIARDCRDATVLAELAEADTAAASAVEGFLEWLGTDLLPRSDGPAALDPGVYARLLRDETLREDGPEALASVVTRAIPGLRVFRDWLAAGVAADSTLREQTLARGDSAIAWRVSRALRRPPRDPERWWVLAALSPASAVRGWAEYVARESLEVGDGEAGRKVAAKSRELAMLGRLAAEIEIHVRGDSVAGAAAMIEQRCGLDAPTALALARQAAIEPGMGAAGLQVRGLVELRDRVWQWMGPRFDAKGLDDALLDEAPAPVAVTGERVLRRFGIAAIPAAP